MTKRKTNRRRLTPDEAAEALLAMLRDGERPRDVAARMGMDRTTLLHMASGATWSHVLPELPRKPRQPKARP